MSKNTYTKGLARVLIYEENNVFNAVCLDFDIIEQANTKNEVVEQITEAIKGYITCVIDNKLDPKLLNRRAPKKYWNMYDEYLKILKARNEERVSVSKDTRNWSFFSMPVRNFARI